MSTPTTQHTTEHLIREIEVALCLPVTQLRAHWNGLGKQLIAHMRQLEAAARPAPAIGQQHPQS
jgi:hypothetical protein